MHLDWEELEKIYKCPMGIYGDATLWASLSTVTLKTRLVSFRILVVMPIKILQEILAYDPGIMLLGIYPNKLKT